MSRFIQGNCIQIMSGFPDKAVDFILTDPPYLVDLRTAPGAPLPATGPTSGYSPPVMRCTAC